MRLLMMLVFSLAAGAASAAEDKPNAKLIYEQRCAFCHGTDGKGDGPAGAALSPPPPNFASADYWKTRDVAQVRRAVVEGKPGTPMIPFGNALKKKEIDAVVELVTKFKP